MAAPYLMLAAPLGALVFGLTRRWLGTAVAILLTVVSAYVQWPLFTADGTNSAGVQIRIMTANVYLGQANADVVVATAVASADVLAVQELTPDEVDRMGRAGLDRAFPYRALDARDYASGVGLWSRYPIVESHRIAGYKLAMVSARIRIDGVSSNPTVVVAHLPGPWPQPIDDWEGDLRRMGTTLLQTSDVADGGCSIIAGDFNSTFDMKPFRTMLGNDFRDGAEQAGAGFIPTYPGNSRLPPFMAIDHVLTSRCTATAARSVALPGSDHRGLVVGIDVSATPSSGSLPG